MKLETKPSSGRLFQKSDIDHFRGLRKAHYAEGFSHEKEDKHGVRRAEEFSREIIEQLLAVSGCAGLTVCYGAAPETDYKIDREKGKKVMPRLFIVPVDANGNHLTFEVRADGEKDAGGSFAGAGDGKPCPPGTGCPTN
jgi:hypothetical protein